MTSEPEHAFRESGSETPDLQFGRKLMTYKESAMTTTSDNMGETSQMTRNNTIDDFHDFADSDEFPGPELPPDVKYDDDKYEGSGAGSEDNIDLLVDGLSAPSVLMVPPVSPGNSAGTIENHSPLSIDPSARDPQSDSEDQSYPDLSSMGYQGDIEDSVTSQSSSAFGSVDQAMRKHTSRSFRVLIDALSDKYELGPIKKWQEHGIWALIRHQLTLDKISIRRRSGIQFERASKAFYVDHPEICAEPESDSESLLLSGSSHSCCPHSGTLPQKVYQVFDRSDTWTGAVIAFVIMAFIILSLVCMCMESLPAYRFPNYGDSPEDIAPIFDLLEVICVSVFTVEYGARIWSAGFVSWEVLGTKPPTADKDTPFRKRLYFFLGMLNMIDFLAIVPFYLEILTNSSGLSGSLTILRLLRLLRVLRLFKLGRHVQSIRLYANVIFEVAPALVILLLFLTFLWVIGSSLMYIVESGTWDPDFEIPGTDRVGAFTRYSVPADEMITTNFESVFHSLWWAIMTYSLVGYGEIIPTSFYGYGVGILFMIFGIVALSLPIGLVATAFIDVNERYDHSFIDTEDYSRKIIEMCEEGEDKIKELEMMLKNILKKFHKRHRNLENQVRSYQNVFDAVRDYDPDVSHSSI